MMTCAFFLKIVWTCSPKHAEANARVHFWRDTAKKCAISNFLKLSHTFSLKITIFWVQYGCREELPWSRFRAHVRSPLISAYHYWVNPRCSPLLWHGDSVNGCLLRTLLNARCLLGCGNLIPSTSLVLIWTWRKVGKRGKIVSTGTSKLLFKMVQHHWCCWKSEGCRTTKYSKRQEIFDTFKLSTADAAKYDTVLAHFDDYCKPSYHKAYQDYLFFTRSQTPGKSMESFYNDVFRLLLEAGLLDVTTQELKERLFAAPLVSLNRSSLSFSTFCQRKPLLFAATLRLLPCYERKLLHATKL